MANQTNAHMISTQTAAMIGGQAHHGMLSKKSPIPTTPENKKMSLLPFIRLMLKDMPEELVQPMKERVLEEYGDIKKVSDDDPAKAALTAARFLHSSLAFKAMGHDIPHGQQMRQEVVEKHGGMICHILFETAKLYRTAQHGLDSIKATVEEVQKTIEPQHEALQVILKSLDSPIDAEDKVAYIREILAKAGIEKES